VSKVATSQSGMFERREGAATFNYNNLDSIFGQCNILSIFSFLFKMQEKWDMQHWGSDDCLAERPKKLKNNYLKNNFQS
jgi:hypothetical protein